MADKQSDILKFQDKNNDGTHDECPEVDFKEVKECPTCKPDPNAFVENWKKKINGDAWFNEKYCTFQTTIIAAEKSLLPEGLGEEYSENDLEELADIQTEELFKKYEVEATIALLEEFDKLNTETTRETIRAALEHSKYDLSPRNHSHVKLLYTVPFAVMEPIDLAPPDAEDNEPVDSGGVTVRYVATEIAPMLNRFRKAMHLYSRYYRVYQAMQHGSLIFEGPLRAGKVFTPKQFDKYGDGLFGRNSIMYEMLLDLDSWLNGKQMNIVGFGGTKKAARGVTELEFTFTAEYKLDKLTVWTAGCSDPINYSAKNSLKNLTKRPSWKDATGCAYFSRLKETDQDLRARVAIPWQQFIQKHTWPKLIDAIDYGKPSPSAGKKKGPDTALGCVAESLKGEMKELGQDIMDDVFSIGDSIAAAFNENMCKVNRDEALDETIKLGLVWDPETKTHRNVGAMAKEMAFKQLYKDEQVFTRLCAQMLEGKLNASSAMQQIMPSSPAAKTDAMWRPLETIKNCGMFDLLLSAVKCLFKGFSLQEALRSMINSALKNMDIENFGKFFIGLPPDKQAEVVEKVKIALANPPARTGKIIDGKAVDAFSKSSKEAWKKGREENVNKFKDKVSDKAPWLTGGSSSNAKLTPPWEDKQVIEAERERKGLTPEKQVRTLPELATEALEQLEGSVPGESDAKGSSQKSTGTSDDSPFKINDINALTMAPEIIIQAYITALLEVYQEDYLELIDYLNNLPGAPIVASIIAMIECPHPPLFKPSMMDFIKSIELPFCRDINDITLPGMNNPFEWFPDLWDLVKLLFEIAKMVIMQVILAIIMKLIIKLCQLIGDAICKALELVGTAAVALATGANVMDAIKDALCGDDADTKKVEDTANEIFEKLGVGGAALANPDAVTGFLGDLSSAITPRELNEALSGQAGEAFLEVADSLVEYEYPEFRDGFSNKSDLADFFASMGNLFPADVRNAMQDMLNTTPAANDVPANPSLCASPQAIDDFKELRCELLSNRATAAQCRDMFDNIQAENLEDLGDLGDILQKGFPKMLEDALPPLISTPGCDDGLIPFESEDSIKVTSTVISDSLKGLKISYAKDMIGQGGFLTGDASWGMVNMILSDTSGIPLSKHQQNAYRDFRVVDFAQAIGAPSTFPEFMDMLIGSRPPPTAIQSGMYPSYVAEWLQQEMAASSDSMNFVSNNEYKESSVFYRSFEQLGFDAGFGLFSTVGSRVNLLKMPDYGYNVVYGVDLDASKLKITRLGRKDDPEVTLSFYNGRKGRVQRGSPWDWGYKLNLYLSEMRDEDGSPYNVFADTARISIVNQINAAAIFGGVSVSRDRKYEFVSVDDTLDKYDTLEYPNFHKAFEIKQPYIPQVILLNEMINVANPGSNTLTLANVKEFYDATMNSFMSSIINEVVNNTNAWEYGAQYDDLTEEDIEYVVKPGQSDSPGGTLYSDATVDGEPLDSDMSILGYSRMQYEEEEKNSGRPNRVVYLSPMDHGGSFMMPALYIKPIANKGWLGLVNMMFPELNGCKPFRTDLVDFADISEEVQDSYGSIPEDERLEFGDCAQEVPYNRILMRPSKAGIQGVITAACRIYASAHFIKSMATFTTFAPKFPETYSSLYATYVIENMEEAFKDAQNDRRERWNSFKDYEFWYAFLEQAVQTYGRRVEMGEITAPATALRAMRKINDMQEGFYTRSRNELWKDIFSNDERLTQTYKNYKMKYNLMAIQRTEEYAKIVLKEIVLTELNKMGEIFTSNFKLANITPKYNDIEGYSLMNFTAGGEALTISTEIIPTTAALPTEGTALYTDGGELSTQPAGEDYVGYYHIQEDENGNKMYMEGEYHSSNLHGELTVYANQMIIPVGDVADYGNLSKSPAANKPMQIEKYIKINGNKHSIESAYDIISAQPGGLSLYEVYPGTMKKVMEEDSEGNEMVVGISGEIGVRYGLEYSIVIKGTAYKITSVEVDALDLPLSKFKKLGADSMQLHCLLNLLKRDEKYQLINKYVFALNKLTATTAIYNDYGFLPSIGEYTVAEGAAASYVATEKPGVTVNLADNGELESYTFTKGWEYGSDRKPSFWTWGTLEFDDWDQVILRKSKAKIKRIFKNYYNVRKTRPGDSIENDPSKAYVENLLSSMATPPGLAKLNWRQMGLLRPNPYNSKGKLCKK
tara:strand:- start:4160 stop:10645 length:6486 start_codon:yes stop_codon:yes gene_type:complete